MSEKLDKIIEYHRDNGHIPVFMISIHFGESSVEARFDDIVHKKLVQFAEPRDITTLANPALIVAEELVKAYMITKKKFTYELGLELQGNQIVGVRVSPD